MPAKTVVLIGYEDQPNLGIGYLASVLTQQGFAVEILDFRLDHRLILERIQQINPLIIGLSLIFQYFTPSFSELVRFLRDQGVNCTICAGGHYPSLCPQDVLVAMPGLDCVVRFEGEYTLLELANCLAEGRDWHNIQSIAYLNEGRLNCMPLRPLIANLDSLPFPIRASFSSYQCLGVPTTTILASRGCPRGCSFCSIRRFYSIPPGHIRRTRSPENVVQEMLHLYHAHGARIFLFQDDDFFLIGKKGQKWAKQFIECLQHYDLTTNIIWKISCRADEIEAQTFATLKQAGLFLVYLGLESGNEIGLHILNKNITVNQNREAVATLKAVGLNYEFGFMLFDPSSTMDLVLENIHFLQGICNDGSSPIPFCKMLPYAGTDIEEQLRREGRLRGNVRHPDYNFVDRRIEAWFIYLSEVLHPWVFGRDCLLARLRSARFELQALEHFFPQVQEPLRYGERVKALVQWYNEIFCRIVEDSAPYFESLRTKNPYALQAIHESAGRQRRWLETQLEELRKTFLAVIDLAAVGAPVDIYSAIPAGRPTTSDSLNYASAENRHKVEPFECPA